MIELKTKEELKKMSATKLYKYYNEISDYATYVFGLSRMKEHESKIR